MRFENECYIIISFVSRFQTFSSPLPPPPLGHFILELGDYGVLVKISLRNNPDCPVRKYDDRCNYRAIIEIDSIVRESDPNQGKINILEC